MNTEAKATRAIIYYRGNLPSKWHWPWKENLREKALMEEWNTILSILNKHEIISSRRSTGQDTKFYATVPTIKRSRS